MSKKIQMLTAHCETCGWSVESMGRDESSRNSIKVFKAEHTHEGEARA